MKLLSLSLALALSAASFSADAIQARPLVAEYSPSTSSGILTVSNPASTAKTYQVIVERWTALGPGEIPPVELVEAGKVKGQQVRTPSTALRILPSVFTMEPGKSQTLRWALKSDGSPEQAYRIVLEEVPDPEVLKGGGIYQSINLDFPWFWRDRNLTPDLSIRWDGPTLVVSNAGQATAQLVNLVAGSVNRPGLVGYVLPGETARFELGAKAAVPVSVKVNGKDITLVAQ